MGSCQAFKAVRSNETHDKQRENKQQPTLLPSLRSDSRDSLKRKTTDDSKGTTKTKSTTRGQKYTKTHLPTINIEKNSLVTQSYDSTSSPRNETPNTKKTTKRNKKEHYQHTDSPVYYAKIDIITERECFGLQSLVFDDNPSLSLVSNGAECVLISKQFLREHMDNEIKRRLQSKIAPYPNLNQIQNAVDDKLAWESYREKVLNDSLR